MNKKTTNLDIIIPVFNEAENIVTVFDSFKKHIKNSFRVQICFDNENDTTLPVVKSYDTEGKFEIALIRNKGKGPHAAVMTGFENARAEAILVFPADDFLNAVIIDEMVKRFREGNHIVAASRFMPGGSMKGCPLLKSLLVRTASFTLYRFAFIPIKDASNGFRLFSKRLLDLVKVESILGFTYSIELLVKTHRLGWKIAEVPANWIERKKGKSNFKILNWLPHYLRWYIYGFETTYLRKTKVATK